MTARKIEVETAEAFARTFVKGNVPKISAVRCLACGHFVKLRKELGPDVLDIVEGVAKPVQPENCIGDGACMLACPPPGRGKGPDKTQATPRSSRR